MPVSRSLKHPLLALMLSLLLPHLVQARFSYGTCCEKANVNRQLFSKNNQTKALQRLLVNYTQCGQQYDRDISPAPDVYIRYSECTRSCKGFALSEASDPNTWAAPLVQFVLPSVIFSMSIPRRTLFVPFPNFGPGHISSAFNAVFGLLFATVDTVVWVAVILTLAGPLMVSGLTEAILDRRLLAACSSTRYRHLKDSTRLKLLMTVVCGNIKLQGDPGHRRRCPLIGLHDIPCPVEKISKALETLDQSCLRQVLLDLMSAQGDFGALVGAPVIFYMGGFLYTILDLLEDPSAQAAAISLAFGVNWMIVVHVAITSGCLLASNNPSALSVLASEGGHIISQKWYQLPLVYKTAFQPVSMWWRGSNKKAWLASIKASVGDVEQESMVTQIRADVHIGFCGYLILVYVPTLVLISLPPAAGAFVAWKTPPVGWGCRSLTLVVYAACQLLMVSLQELRAYHNVHGRVFSWTRTTKSSSRERMASHLVRVLCIGESAYHGSLLILYLLLCVVSVFTALGGTIMQISGVYGNCFCYVNSQMWFRLDEAFVNVASDTFDQRHSSKNWIIMGSVATGFMVACSFLGWGYQKKIRAEYRTRVGLLAMSP